MVNINEEEIRKDERTRIWKIIDKNMKRGQLEVRENFERRGAIRVLNMIYHQGINSIKRGKDGKVA